MMPSQSKSNEMNKGRISFLPTVVDSDIKTPSTFIRIENKPFRIYTCFYIGNREGLMKELKKKENINAEELKIEDEKTFSGITVPCTTSMGHSFVLIWLPTFDWSIEDFETLSHECLHATIMVMRMSGVRSKIFSAEDDESCDDEGIAYGQSSLFSSILSKLGKKYITSHNRRKR